MLLPRMILLLFLLAGCGIGPGWWIVRRLRLAPAEKIVTTPLLSFIVIYLVGLALYLLDAPPGAYFAVSAICAIATIAALPSFIRMARRRGPSAILRSQLLVILGAGVMLLLVRGYGGGTWSGDWVEQFQRTRFFLHDPAYAGDVRFISKYPLATRPPLMNIATAFFLRQTGVRFELFHITYFICSAMAFSAAALLLRVFEPRADRTCFLLAALFLVNPSFLENATFAWTKLPASAFVLAGMALYLRTIGRPTAAPVDLARTALCFALLSAGSIIHWLGVPYLALIGLHFLVTRARPNRRFTDEAMAAALAMAIVLAPWAIWISHRAGAAKTVTLNPTVAESIDRTPGDFIERTFVNLYCSFAPHPLNGEGFASIPQQSAVGALRDYVFLMYQSTLPMMMGSVGGIIAIWRYIVAMRSRRPDLRAARRFWIFFVPCIYVIGIAVNPERATTGLAQIILVPLALSGLTLIASQARRISSVWRLVWIAGCVVDAALGVILQFFLENRGQHVLSLFPDLKTDTDLSWTSTANWISKVQQHIVFLGDHLAGYWLPLRVLAVLVEVASLVAIARFLLAPAARRRRMAFAEAQCSH